ncbi:adenylyl-sulfate kinase [Aneurinibacillus migulanus]|uniref:Adenylyl-sulfate kinase n=1 Tax=Aneurinibacillus migulanus TaxID=47500 RepID=A0A0D1YAT3_ANEMI|nr:adenylyl-sulfate kinase [Aneurinibacillus migulanus]KIV56242.1 adenylylsulfate kinase [Aneurinibacillus migulanus]KON84310.1 adenylylsulfate kinase [Aneurinibacillus migulanus]MED0893866.1 adenylyl-sulfate kinase [Aneurinibacillus migulanus]MED1614545.1 adenylyl-sulfate kinase [Aneurinibacillus migulanus]SDI85232.1 adenylylsulfate kinase [Aneurinibacillus migulanus]
MALHDTNIVWHQATVTKADRQRKSGHKSVVLWFTGLSGAGKSTLANEVERRLYEKGVRTYLLDGDNIRHGINKDLGFSPEDRTENIRRIGEVSKLFVDAGVVVLTAFISPYRADRELARSLVEADEFIEVYVKCAIEECENRDPKGLYKKAKAGEIPEFTGISAPYEEPENPELIVTTDAQSLDVCAEQVVEYLKKKIIFE